MSLATFKALSWTARRSVCSLWTQWAAQALGPQISVTSESLLMQKTRSPWSLMLLDTGPDFRMCLIPSSCLTLGKSTLSLREWFYRQCVVTRSTLQNVPCKEDLKTYQHTHENICKGKGWEKLLLPHQKFVASPNTLRSVSERIWLLQSKKNES